MASTHRKIRHKDLKRPDEFISLVDKSRELLKYHLPTVLAVLAGVAVVVGLTIGIRAYREHRANIAANEFYEAFGVLDSKDYAYAAQLFQKLIADAPGTQVGHLAQFYLATCYLQEGKLDQARESLSTFLKSPSDALFTSLATMNLGVIYERLGKFAEAEAAYRQAAELPGPEQLRAQLGLARVLANQGHKEQAVEAYRSFLGNNPYAPERQQAIEALAELGAPANPPATPTSDVPASIERPSAH
jgi:predicted negative regulator of RcsB-dependent stress response